MDRLDSMGLLETMQKEANVNINDEYRFRDWLKSTHNKDVHQLTPQEYIVISKQYRDEKAKRAPVENQELSSIKKLAGI
jgi:hypothetical protein